jgi:hypothetical protein
MHLTYTFFTNTGFTQNIELSIDHLEPSKANQKAVIFRNGQFGSSILMSYIYGKNMYFSTYKYDENQEWLLSTPLTNEDSSLKSLKITLTWIQNKLFTLHINGVLADSQSKPLQTPFNNEIYLSSSTNDKKYIYQFGTNSVEEGLTHTFAIKSIRRDYYHYEGNYYFAYDLLFS